jgi:hypothetical protein
MMLFHDREGKNSSRNRYHLSNENNIVPLLMKIMDQQRFPNRYGSTFLKIGTYGF